MYRNFMEKGIQPFKNALPPMYGDSSTTPLTCNVKSTTTVEFKLTSK
jgi:hypothetical protein